MVAIAEDNRHFSRHLENDRYERKMGFERRHHKQMADVEVGEGHT